MISEHFLNFNVCGLVVHSAVDSGDEHQFTTAAKMAAHKMPVRNWFTLWTLDPTFQLFTRPDEACDSSSSAVLVSTYSEQFFTKCSTSDQVDDEITGI